MRAMLISPSGDTICSWDDVETVIPSSDGKRIMITTLYKEDKIFLGSFCIVVTRDKG